METSDVRPWYKKKRYLVPSVFVGAFLIAGAMGDSPTPVPASNQLNAQVNEQSLIPSQVTTQKPIVSPIQSPVKDTNPDLSNDNYYTNSAGNEVHSPAYAPSVPAGASARCRDGTYSFSQSRRGTCSHHGGVAQWL